MSDKLLILWNTRWDISNGKFVEIPCKFSCRNFWMSSLANPRRNSLKNLWRNIFLKIFQKVIVQEPIKEFLQHCHGEYPKNFYSKDIPSGIFNKLLEKFLTNVWRSSCRNIWSSGVISNELRGTFLD